MLIFAVALPALSQAAKPPIISSLRSQSPTQLTATPGSDRFVWSRTQSAGVLALKPDVAPVQAATDFLRARALDLGTVPGALDRARVRIVRGAVGSPGPIIVEHQQMIDDVPVFGGSTRTILDQSMNVIASSGQFVAAPTEGGSRFALSRSGGLVLAIEDAFDASIALTLVKTQGDRTFHRGANGVLATAERSFYPVNGRATPAWRIYLQGPIDGISTGYGYFISASDGSILFRSELANDATFQYRVNADATFPYTPQDSPLGTAQSPIPDPSPDIPLAQSAGPRPLIAIEGGAAGRVDPWLPAGATTTVGNNADAYLDLNPGDGLTPSTTDRRGAVTTPGIFDYSYSPYQSLSATGAADASVVNAFYIVNWLRDDYYAAGFNEASGNAQADNYGRGGEGGDPILVEIQDYSGINNANMLTPGDGISPRMQMFNFDFTNPGTDGAMDSQIVAHEFFHYVSNRLVGNGFGLFNNQGSSLGEGWSDIAALLMTFRTDDNVLSYASNYAGAYSIGYYVTGNLYYSIRRAPYSTRTDINPLTFKHISNSEQLPTSAPILNFGPNSEVHNSGEVWASMLWDGFVAMLNDKRYPAAEALARFKSYMVAGLQITPVFPTFTEARDSFLAAAQASDPADAALLRSAFAKRGMGIAAVSPPLESVDHTGVVESYVADGPWLVTSNPTLVKTNGDIDNDGDGVLDVGDMLTFRFTLTNRGTQPFAGVFKGQFSAPGATFANNGSLSRNFSSAPIAVGASVNINIKVTLDNSAPIATLNVIATFPEMGASPNSVEEPSPLSAFLTVQYDKVPAGSRVDEVIAPEVSSKDWQLASEGETPGWGFDRSNFAQTGTTWFAPNVNTMGKASLTSPIFTVSNSGPLALSFQHFWALEEVLPQPNPAQPLGYDIGVIEISIDNGPWRDISQTPEASVTDGPYNGFWVNDTKRPAYVGRASTSGLIVTRVVFPTLSAGRTVRMRFKLETDELAADLGWFVDNITAVNASPLPFTGVVAQPGSGSAIATAPADFSIVERPSDQAAQARVTVTGQVGGFDNPSGLSYRWSQISGIPVVLENANTPTASFTVPKLKANATVTLSFSATDGLQTANDSVVITLVDRESPPLAPTSTQDADERLPGSTQQTLITLSANASDADGDPLSYTWSQTNGPTVTLSKSDTSQPTFVAPRINTDTTMVFNYEVSDGVRTSSAPVTVNLRNIDSAPTGTPISTVVNERSPNPPRPFTTVTLSTDVTDPDGDPISYQWSQISGPAVELRNPTTASPSFTAPSVQGDALLVFNLKASDTALSSDIPAQVRILDVNLPPTAQFTPQSVPEVTPGTSMPTLVRMQAQASDPDGDTLTYRWTQLGGPSVELSSSSELAPTFTAPAVAMDTQLFFTLEVSDGTTSSSFSEFVKIEDVAQPPVISDTSMTIAERAPGSAEQMVVTLLGQAVDPDNSGTLSYQWTQISGPQVSLSGATTNQPRFIAPRISADVGLVFRVTVSDGTQQSQRDIKVTLTNVESLPTINVADVESFTHEGMALRQVTVAATILDPDDDVTTRTWAQISGPPVQIQGASQSTMSFKAPAVTSREVLTFKITATDLFGSTEKLVNVTIVPGPTGLLTISIQPINGSRPVLAGETVELFGEGSDSVGTPVSYRWRQISGAPVAINNADAARASFVPPTAGIYGMAFTVTNLAGESRTIESSIQVQAKESGSSGGGSVPVVTLVLLAIASVVRRRRLKS